MAGETMILTCERMGNSSEAIAHAEDGRVVFVEGGVPEDVCQVQIINESRKFLKGRVTKVLQPSPYRIVPKVAPEAVATTCPWAIIDYGAQLSYKTQNVKDALIRIGRFSPERTEELVRPCIQPDNPWHYRNKIELSCKKNHLGRINIGEFLPHSDTLVAVKESPLLPERYQKLPKAVSGAITYLANSHELDIQRVGIRASKRLNDVEVSIWTEPGPFPRAAAAKILSNTARISSVVHVITKGPIKARRVIGVERLSGKGHWEENILGDNMQVSAPSFFQVNTKGAEKLVNLVMDALEPDESDIAMDLYCGVGTFTVPLAQKTNFVDAVEAYGPAVRDLRRNLNSLNLENVEAAGGDADREFPDDFADIIVVDPPRAGLAPEVIDKLNQQKARTIAYVSCDPATLARDLASFEAADIYRVEWVQPVDLFAQTHHVENVVKLQRVK